MIYSNSAEITTANDTRCLSQNCSQRLKTFHSLLTVKTYFYCHTFHTLYLTLSAG